MKFIVRDEIWQQLPDACFGVVVARGLDNGPRQPAIDCLLDESIESVRRQFGGTDVRDDPRVGLYRQAFTRLGFNPNKFQSSVEALLRRVVKSGELPRINGIVDLVNVISLKHVIPIGAHDLRGAQGDIEIRYSRPGDSFVPFGTDQPEQLEPGELIYARGDQVKTRRWIWRQSEIGKITPDSADIFFPLDGFSANQDAVLAARDELAGVLAGLFQCRVNRGLVDREQGAVEL